MVSTQGVSPDLLTLVTRAACISGYQYHITVTMRDTVFGRLLPLGHCTDSRLRHNPRLSVRETSLLVLELWPKGQVSGLAHISWPVELLTRNIGCGRHLSALPLPYSSWPAAPAEFVHTSGAPIFSNATQGTPLDLACNLEHYIYLHTFESCSGSGFPSA